MSEPHRGLECEAAMDVEPQLHLHLGWLNLPVRVGRLDVY